MASPPSIDAPTHAQEEDIDSLIPPSPPPPIPPSLPTYKTAFLNACLSARVLTFGSYTLKSGRQSPYFFNAGLFHRADLLRAISTAFASTLIAHCDAHPAFAFDVVFGPSYKGVPLATATVDKLAEMDGGRFGEVSYSFNRKEVKDHGEGGMIVGAPLGGKRVVVVDDVITAGTAMREAIEIIRAQGGRLVGVVVAVDRMERVREEGGKSAIGEVEAECEVPVLSIVNLNDLIEVLEAAGDEREMERVKEYKLRYGAEE
ncbi:orotate phosphoribosyltransferase [Puttea exsequens]|nr:orotate phosphoribosyltransferase [Puttea exsequens]